MPVPLYIGGEWQEISGVAVNPVHNPSTGEVIAETPMCTASHVNEAVEAAAAAFPAWWETPPTERARVFFRLKTLLEEHFEELVRGKEGRPSLLHRGDGAIAGRRAQRRLRRGLREKKGSNG